MALYAFEVLDHGASRHDGAALECKKITTDLPDREAARDFALEMADSILKGQEGSDGARFSLIAISDETGDVLDTIRSEWI